MAGTEEMYWAVTEFSACAGIEVTASHNPINYNGMKIVKSGSQPLEDAGDFQVIKALAGSQEWSSGAEIGKAAGSFSMRRAEAYVDRVLSFVDVQALRPLKIVVNSGNGAAGPTFDTIAERLIRAWCTFRIYPSASRTRCDIPEWHPQSAFVSETILRRLTWSRLRARTLAWHLTVILTAASSSMTRDNLCQANMSSGCWHLSFWKKRLAPRLSMTRGLFGTRKTLSRTRAVVASAIENGPRLHQADNALA